MLHIVRIDVKYLCETNMVYIFSDGLIKFQHLSDGLSRIEDRVPGQSLFLMFLKLTGDDVSSTSDKMVRVVAFQTTRCIGEVGQLVEGPVAKLQAL